MRSDVSSSSRRRVVTEEVTPDDMVKVDDEGTTPDSRSTNSSWSRGGRR